MEKPKMQRDETMLYREQWREGKGTIRNSVGETKICVRSLKGGSNRKA